MYSRFSIPRKQAWITNNVIGAAMLGQAGALEPSSMFVGTRPGKVLEIGTLGAGCYLDMNAGMGPLCLACSFSDTELRLNLGALHPFV